MATVLKQGDMVRIEISKIGYDPQYYPRVNGKEDWVTVHRYKEVLTSTTGKEDANNEGAFPPIRLVKATGEEYVFMVLDGLHRLRAFHKAGLTQIWAIIERIPKSKWLIRSVQLNVSSKRALDSGDKAWIAKKLQSDGHSIQKIAGILEMEVCSIEKLMATRIEKVTASESKCRPVGRGNRKVNGGSYGFLKAPFAETSGTANAKEALEVQGIVASRDTKQIVSSFLAVLRAKTIDLTDTETEEYMIEIKRLVAVLV